MADHGHGHGHAHGHGHGQKHVDGLSEASSALRQRATEAQRKREFIKQEMSKPYVEHDEDDDEDEDALYEGDKVFYGGLKVLAMLMAVFIGYGAYVASGSEFVGTAVFGLDAWLVLQVTRWASENTETQRRKEARDFKRVDPSSCGNTCDT